MKNLAIIVLTSLSLTLVGCGATKNVAEQQKEANERNQLFIQSKASVDKLTERFAQAKADNLGYYAKSLYKDALDEMEDVNDEFDDIRFSPQKTTKSIAAEIQSYVAKTNSYLDQAYLIKKSVDTVLAETTEQMNRLKAINANKYYPKSFAKYTKQIDGMVKDIADGDVKDAQADQAKLLPLLYALEGKTVKHVKLTPLQKRLNGIAKFKRTAPISYQKAVATLQSAEAVITANPRATAEIDVAVEKVKLEIDHVNHIVMEIKSLAAVKSKNRETYILILENKINDAAQALELNDLRALSINEQFNALRDQGQILISEKVQNQEQLATLTSQLEAKDQLINANSKDGKAVMKKLDEKLVYIGQLEQKIANETAAHKQALLAKDNAILTLSNKIKELQLSQQAATPAQPEATPVQAAQPAETAPVAAPVEVTAEPAQVEAAQEVVTEVKEQVTEVVETIEQPTAAVTEAPAQ